MAPSDRKHLHKGLSVANALVLVAVVEDRIRVLHLECEAHHLCSKAAQFIVGVLVVESISGRRHVDVVGLRIPAAQPQQRVVGVQLSRESTLPVQRAPLTARSDTKPPDQGPSTRWIPGLLKSAAVKARHKPARSTARDPESTQRPLLNRQPEEARRASLHDARAGTIRSSCRCRIPLGTERVSHPLGHQSEIPSM